MAKSPAKKPTETEVKEAEIPKDLKVTINGEDRTLTMSFGLKNLLATQVGSVEEVQLVMMEVSRSNDLVDAIIANRDESGNLAEPHISVMQGDIMDEDTYQEILDWGLKHVMRFFIKRAKAFSSAAKTMAPELQALYKLANGLESSVSPTP